MFVKRELYDDFLSTRGRRRREKKKKMGLGSVDAEYARASNFSTRIHPEFFTTTVQNETIKIVDVLATLPEKTLYSLPRLNAKTGEIETNVRFRNDETYENVLIGQAVPGLAIAGGVVAIVALAMALKFGRSVFSACCCYKCKKMCKPFPYTRSALRQTKLVMVLFAFVGAVGCFVVFSCENVLTQELTEAADAVRDVLVKLENETYPSIEASLKQSIDEGVFVSTSNVLEEIREEMSRVKDVTKEYDDEISTNAKMAERATLGLTSVLFIVSTITTMAIVRGNWHVIAFCSIWLTSALVLVWIVFGGVSALGVALDDAHFMVDKYLISPKNVDVSAIVTCADASTSLKVVNELRAATYSTINGANEKMIQIDPFDVMKEETSPVRLMNAMFRPVSTSDLCASETDMKKSADIVDGIDTEDDANNNNHSSSSSNIHSSSNSDSSGGDEANNDEEKKRRRRRRRRRLLHDSPIETGRYEFTMRSDETSKSFEATTCDFYRHNSSSVAEVTYVKTDEPGYIDASSGYYLDTNVYDFETTHTRCDLAASTETTVFANRCFLVESSDDPWIPHDTYDAVKSHVEIAKELIRSLPKAHLLVTCEYLWLDPNKDSQSEAEREALSGLWKTEERLESSIKTAILMWTGVLITGVAFFCMWIILMVAVQRLRNEDLMIDGDSFDPEKAGYEIY